MGFCTKCGSYLCKCYEQEYDPPKKFNLFEPSKKYDLFEPPEKYNSYEPPPEKYNVYEPPPEKYTPYEPPKKFTTFEPSKEFERPEDNGPNCPYCKRNHYGMCNMRVRYAHDPHLG